MAPPSTPQEKTRYASLSLEEALRKLRETSEIIESREGVKQHEGRRIQEALRLVKILLAPAPSTSKTADRKESYQQFLRKVENLCGLEMVTLCAVALGKSAVASMRDHVRLRLPSKIKIEEDTLKCSTLPKLIGEYSNEATTLEIQIPEPNSEDVQDKLVQDDRGRQIERMYSSGPISQISLFGELLSNAIQSSHQWKKERDLGESTTNCWTTMMPKDPNEDISITMWLGRRDGYRVNEVLMVEPTWSSLSLPRPA